MPIYEVNDHRVWFERLSDFIEAYDAWAVSPEHCGGELFDTMVMARQNMDENFRRQYVEVE